MIQFMQKQNMLKPIPLREYLTLETSFCTFYFPESLKKLKPLSHVSSSTHTDKTPVTENLIFEDKIQKAHSAPPPWACQKQRITPQPMIYPARVKPAYQCPGACGKDYVAKSPSPQFELQQRYPKRLDFQEQYPRYLKSQEQGSKHFDARENYLKHLNAKEQYPKGIDLQEQFANRNPMRFDPQEKHPDIMLQEHHLRHVHLHEHYLGHFKPQYVKGPESPHHMSHHKISHEDLHSSDEEPGIAVYKTDSEKGRGIPRRLLSSPSQDSAHRSLNGIKVDSAHSKQGSTQRIEEEVEQGKHKYVVSDNA